MKGNFIHLLVSQSKYHNRIPTTSFVTYLPKRPLFNLFKNQPSSSSSPSAVVPKTYSQSKIILYNQQEIFDVVIAVERYKEFLPWCLDSKVLAHQGSAARGFVGGGSLVQGKAVVGRQEHGSGSMKAELTVGFNFLKEKYVSNITYEAPYKINIVAEHSQLFEYLNSEWLFRKTNSSSSSSSSSSSDVLFKLDFCFKSSIHNALLEQVYLSVQKDMLKAFEDRCHLLYGK